MGPQATGGASVHQLGSARVLQGSRQLSLHGKRVATVERMGYSGAGMPLPQGIESASWMQKPSMPPPSARAPSVRAMAGSLQLLGPVGGGVERRDQWIVHPSPAERATIDALRTGADMRVASFVEEGRAAHLRTALGWLRRFYETMPSRVPFVPYAHGGDLQAAAYNEETFRLFAEFVRQHGSVRSGFAGMAVSSSTISDYISALRAFLSRETGYNLLLDGGNLRLPKQLHHMRKEDGPAGQRELSRGLTARILRRLLGVTGFFRAQRELLLRWAVLWLAHNLMMRGGELGVTDKATFSPTTGLTIADLDWIEPCEETSFFPALVVDMMPIKDTHNSRQRIPCPVRRVSGRPTGRLLSEPEPCAWDAVRRFWLVRSGEVPPAQWASSPFFAHENGSPVCTSDVKAFIRQAAEAAGEPPEDFDARALRIGGATDLYHLMGGAAEAERVLQKRGRWCSLIGDIYARISATAMLSTSAALSQVDGVDLEAFRHGYVMPARVSRGRFSRSY